MEVVVLTKLITKTTLKDQAYVYLKKAILNGEIEVGKNYSEQWFADFLGVSRTPVREAILQIRREGLLETLPCKGIVVKELSLSDIEKTFQIRLALEGFCVITLAQESDTKIAQKLISNLGILINKQTKLAAAQDKYEFMEIDELFHREILSYVDNSKFIENFEDIRSRVERLCMDTLRMEGRMESTIKEHNGIFESIRSAKPWEAYTAMETHLINAKKMLMCLCKDESN